jgi:hypothetical protein
MIILGTVLVITQAVFSQQTNTCSDNVNGVTFCTDINYQGQCHTLGPGDYELALFGLEQNVSSIKDPHDAYHITLFDKAKNFFYIDSNNTRVNKITVPQTIPLSTIYSSSFTSAHLLHLARYRPRHGATV